MTSWNKVHGTVLEEGWMTSIRASDLHIEMSPAILFSSQGTFFFPCSPVRPGVMTWVMQSRRNQVFWEDGTT